MNAEKQYRNMVLKELDNALETLYKQYYKSYDKNIKKVIDKIEAYKLKCLITYCEIIERDNN